MLSPTVLMMVHMEDLLLLLRDLFLQDLLVLKDLRILSTLMVEDHQVLDKHLDIKIIELNLRTKTTTMTTEDTMMEKTITLLLLLPPDIRVNHKDPTDLLLLRKMREMEDTLLPMNKTTLEDTKHLRDQENLRDLNPSVDTE